MGVVTLISWLITASIGGYMLSSIVGVGGRRRGSGHRRLRHPPAVLIAHFSLALSGLAVWASYLATGLRALAWLAIGLLAPAIGLGISTVTVWTPFPGPLPAERAGPPACPGSDEELASVLADAGRASQLIDDMLARMLAPPAARGRSAWRLRTLIPVSHGVAAGATFLFAVLTVAGGR